MNCSEIIRARRSIRKYKEDCIVPQGHIERMLEAAMMAPSACNTRPWEFVVVESSEGKQKLMECHPYTQMLKTASLAIIVCGRPDLQQGKCNEFWPQDCGAAIENILLEARSLGYGSCWCGCYPVMERVAQIQCAFDINSIPVAIVAVGEADEEPEARGFFDETRVTYVR